MFRLGMRGRSAAREVETRARLKARLSELLALAPEDVVSITELSCSADGCPDSEIVIAILRAGAPVQVAKFHGPLDSIAEAALAEAFAAPPPSAG